MTEKKGKEIIVDVEPRNKEFRVEVQDDTSTEKRGTLPLRFEPVPGSVVVGRSGSSVEVPRSPQRTGARVEVGVFVIRPANPGSVVECMRVVHTGERTDREGLFRRDVGGKVTTTGAQEEHRGAQPSKNHSFITFDQREQECRVHQTFSQKRMTNVFCLSCS